MKLTVLGALSLMLFAGGCTVSTTSTHTLDSGLFTVFAGGGCSLLSTAGPYAVPSGTDFDLTLSDSAGSYDLVDITIIDASFGSCDFSLDGYPFTDVFAGGGNAYPSALGVLGGNYDVYARCNNPSADCQFSMVWDATY